MRIKENTKTAQQGELKERLKNAQKKKQQKNISHFLKIILVVQSRNTMFT
jgi:hypothetical protein